MNLGLRELWARVVRWYATHSERDRRIILFVAVAVAFSIVYVSVVEPLRDYRRSVAEEVSEGQERLERYARVIAAGDSRRAERDELRKRLGEARGRLLPGGSGTLGAAALQEQANGLAGERGVTVQSTQVMKEEAADPFRKVTVRFMLSGELKPFADFVAGLEGGTHQLALPFIEVSRRGAVAGAKGPRTLTATVEVSGYVAVGEQAKAGEGEAAEGEAAPGSGEGEGTPGEEQVGPPPPAEDPLAAPPPAAASPPAAPAPAPEAAAAAPSAAPTTPPQPTPDNEIGPEKPSGQAPPPPAPGAS